jgi:hypothetical protein
MSQRRAKILPFRDNLATSVSEEHKIKLNQGKKDIYGDYFANWTPLYYICPFLPYAPTY